ncbi:hypothetical protein S40288_01591 [Stachybotrys chartarum IBT 40288]|nr:hypothetical protein S40288_01591 [Stachybotrys chartarum IBT 40288]
MKPSSGCNTCKARKVRCDGIQPSCQRCTKSGRVCAGYSTQLFWPRKNDMRRAIVVASPKHFLQVARRRDVRFISTTSWDVMVHRHLMSDDWMSLELEMSTPLLRGSMGDDSYALAPKLSPVLRWVPHHLDSSSRDLMEYFDLVVVRALRIIGQSATTLRSALIRMAFSDSTPSAKAVLRALLALSSLHRHGSQKQAESYKYAALGAMREAARVQLQGKTLLQHVAASMLLCTFESETVRDASHQWVWYLGSACSLARMSAQDPTAREDDDYTVLMGWVQYYDVVSRFSLYHWKPETPAAASLTQDKRIMCMLKNLCDLHRSPYPRVESHQILHLLGSGIRYICMSREPVLVPNLQVHLQKIAQELISADFRGPSPANSYDQRIPELYQIAALVYLSHAAPDVFPRGIELHGLTERAFTLLDELDSCPWLMLLVLFACEARSDEKRAVILRLVEEAEKDRGRFEGLRYAREMIRFRWVQDDLGGGDASYVRRMDVLMSTSGVLPILL